jgi:hypothetical protein
MVIPNTINVLAVTIIASVTLVTAMFSYKSETEEECVNEKPVSSKRTTRTEFGINATFRTEPDTRTKDITSGDSHPPGRSGKRCKKCNKPMHCSAL